MVELVNSEDISNPIKIENKIIYGWKDKYRVRSAVIQIIRSPFNEEKVILSIAGCEREVTRDGVN